MENETLHKVLISSEPRTIRISELADSGISFFIPSYQRGYRWGEVEIERLLIDIINFDPLQDGEFYCLQPVVVRFDKNNQYWRLIDGQQRLTTIYLILSTWEKPPFTILYERDEEKSPVEQYYLKTAVSTIEKWGNEHPASKSFICKRLKDICRVIWYHLPDYESEQISLIKEHDFFLHLNSGKIALTDAELVKASLLHKLRKCDMDPASFNHQQLLRASEWDLMERRLREDDFWRFITGRKEIPASAIDYLLEILYFKYDQPEDEYNSRQNPVFSWIESSESQIHDTNKLWDELWKTFHRLEGWYNDPVIYNLIGVLATRQSLPEIVSKRIVAALKEWEKEGMTKSKFIAWLWDEVMSGLISNDDINKAKHLNSLSLSDYMRIVDSDSDFKVPSYHNYNYKNTRKKVFDTLLLLNIVLINPSETNRKFPFNEFNSPKSVWNIEHISPNNPKNNQKLLEVLKAIRDYVPSNKETDNDRISQWENLPEQIRNDFNTVIEILEKIDTSDGNEAREFPANPNESQRKDIDIVEKFKEDYLPISDKEVMTLGNLTLLTEGPNKGISNNFFFYKRTLLAKYQAKGCFIPPLTLNVFTKWYTADFDQPLFWRKQNRLEYLKALDKLVSGLNLNDAKL